MKTTFRWVMLISSCGLALALPAQAQQGHWYAKADLGGNLTLDTKLTEFFGEGVGGKVKFDPGVRLGIAGGYWLTDWFGLEAETGVMANWIHSIDGAGRVDAEFANVPFLLNARFQCPRAGFVTPYFGGGVGGSAAVIDADHIDIGGTTVDGAESDVVFAYQAFAGLRFRINESMGLSLEYRYFAFGSPEWEGDFNGRMRINGSQTHALSIAFDFRF